MVDTPGPKLDLPRFGDNQPMRVDYRTRGRSGAKNFGGYQLDENDRALQGARGIEVYREMGDTDATCGSVLYTIDKVARQVGWNVKRASDHPRDRAAADFLSECMDDLDTTWVDFISEVLSMLQYGFSLHEIVYKRRGGDAPEAYMRSRFSDGRVGWKGLPIRSQETINRWLTDPLGNIVQVEQMAPPDYQATLIPMEKLLLFRTSTHKGSPLGKSIFRIAHRSFYLKRAIENIEGVGVERDLAGLPVALVPPEVLAQRTQGDQAMFNAMKNIITNIRRDEQEGVIFPMQYDEAGRPLYELKLLTSGGTRNFDTDRIISRYDSRIAMCALADFLLLGQSASAQGSFAMHSDKTKLFAASISAFLDIIAETLNRFAVQRLFALNSFAVDELPRLEHDSVEHPDLGQVGAFIQQIAGAGAAIFPNESIEAKLCEMAGLPTPVNAERAEPLREPLGTPGRNDIEELHEGDPDPPPAPADAPGLPVAPGSPSLVPTPAVMRRA